MNQHKEQAITFVATVLVLAYLFLFMALPTLGVYLVK
jgi:hypothetical protein